LWVEFESIIMKVARAISNSSIMTAIMSTPTVQKPLYVKYMTGSHYGSNLWCLIKQNFDINTMMKYRMKYRNFHQTFTKLTTFAVFCWTLKDFVQRSRCLKLLGFKRFLLIDWD
jgi:hypothetical protein